LAAEFADERRSFYFFFRGWEEFFGLGSVTLDGDRCVVETVTLQAKNRFLAALGMTSSLRRRSG